MSFYLNGKTKQYMRARGIILNSYPSSHKSFISRCFVKFRNLAKTGSGWYVRTFVTLTKKNTTMENVKFSFKEFLIEKGFKEDNAQEFIYEYSDEFHVLLQIENDKFVIPFGITEQFNYVIPKTLEKAEENFRMLARMLEIHFKN